MDNAFLAHNSHLEGKEPFSRSDPHLLRLREHRLIYTFSLLNQFPMDTPGIFTLCGAHLTGKSTLLKNWIEKLLTQGVSPDAIAFFPGELISDYHALHRALQNQLSRMPEDRTIYIIIDDIPFIRDFEKAILPLKKSGSLDRAVLMLSGYDSTLVQSESKNSFHLYPLSFRETVLLKINHQTPSSQILYEQFNQYLVHGGNLVAINEIHNHKRIQDKTFVEYSDWICKETIRRGKQERFLREILKSTFVHYNNQITWNALAPELSIDHPKTIGDYFSWCEALDILFVQYALLENKLIAAPKKARKVMFTDPFFFHVMHHWIYSSKNYFESQLKTNLENPELISNLVKSCVVTQFRRYFPTYYIKGVGEVDLAYVKAENFWPIETSWLTQLRAKDLKQILKYPNGRILTKTDRSGIIQHIQTEPLPLALWESGDLNLS